MRSASSQNKSAQLLLDPALRAIKAQIVESVPYCRAIVVIGSRAASPSPSLSPLQDYDIVVVVPTTRTPFALRKLKRIEAEVIATHGVKVSLNPLPWLRLRYPGCNYMLLKLASEGVVIHGAEVLRYVEQIRPESIDAWWHFFFLTSQAKRLLAVAPAQSGDVPSAREVQYGAAKAILGCAELLVLRSGVYTSVPELFGEHLRSAGNAEVASEVDRASQTIQSLEAVSQADTLWRLARRRLLDTLDLFSDDFLGISLTDSSSEAFAKAFVHSGGLKSPLRDLQFVALTFLGKRELRLRALLDRRGVAERVKLGLFWLLKAWDDGGPPDHALMTEARRYLSGAIRLEPEREGWEEWRSLLSAVAAYYPNACVALGV